MKGIYFLIIMAIATIVNAQDPEAALDAQESSLVKIAALTSAGNQTALKNAFNEGLDAGLSIDQINDVLAQLYAYCGFPRSLNAIHVFMGVMDERKAKGAGHHLSTFSDGRCGTPVTGPFWHGHKCGYFRGRDERAPAYYG